MTLFCTTSPFHCHDNQSISPREISCVSNSQDKHNDSFISIFMSWIWFSQSKGKGNEFPVTNSHAGRKSAFLRLIFNPFVPLLVLKAQETLKISSNKQFLDSRIQGLACQERTNGRNNNFPPHVVGIRLTENAIRQIYRIRLLLHVHRSIYLCEDNASVSQHLADRIKFGTCRYRQRGCRVAATVIGEILLYPCLILDAPHVFRHVTELLHQREDFSSCFQKSVG